MESTNNYKSDVEEIMSILSKHWMIIIGVPIIMSVVAVSASFMWPRQIWVEAEFQTNADLSRVLYPQQSNGIGTHFLKPEFVDAEKIKNSSGARILINHNGGDIYHVEVRGQDTSASMEAVGLMFDGIAKIRQSPDLSNADSIVSVHEKAATLANDLATTALDRLQKFVAKSGRADQEIVLDSEEVAALRLAYDLVVEIRDHTTNGKPTEYMRITKAPHVVGDVSLQQHLLIALSIAAIAFFVLLPILIVRERLLTHLPSE